MTIQPMYDSEEDVWFAGTPTGFPTGPIGQRGEFFAWPSIGGNTPKDCAEGYATRELAESACYFLSQMTREQLTTLCPWFFQ